MAEFAGKIEQLLGDDKLVFGDVGRQQVLASFLHMTTRKKWSKNGYTYVSRVIKDKFGEDLPYPESLSRAEQWLFQPQWRPKRRFWLVIW